MKNPYVNTVVRRVPRRVWVSFRKKCIDRGISANERLKELIESDTKEVKANGGI